MNYYRLRDDINYPNRWYLGDILGVDNWKLADTIPYISGELKIKLVRSGNEMDFTKSEAYGVPIVSGKVRSELVEFSEVTFIPLKVPKPSCQEKYYVMVTLESIDCVDEKNSEFKKFEVNDPVRPDLAGEYSGFFKLRLTANAIENVDIFRVQKFDTAIIISERVKNKLEAICATGLDLEPVT